MHQYSAIQSLRARLAELEALEPAETSSRPREVGGAVADDTTHVPEGSAQLTRESRLDSRTPTGGTELEVSEANAASSGHPHTTYQTPPPTEPCPEPRSFEKLIKPVSRLISRRTDAAPAPLSAPAAARNPAASCKCHRVLSSTNWSLPLRRVADGLVATYFRRVHRIYPILHQRTFQRQYEGLWESDSDSTPAECSGLCRKKNQCRLFAATLQAVFALATLFSPNRPEENAAQADSFFRKAQGLEFFDLLDEETGLELVQLGLIMGFYLQGTEKFSKCWNMTGLTIRLAQNMGLHLDWTEARKRGLAPSRPTQLEYEMRSRVWYGCLTLERYFVHNPGPSFPFRCSVKSH